MNLDNNLEICKAIAIVQLRDIFCTAKGLANIIKNYVLEDLFENKEVKKDDKEYIGNLVYKYSIHMLRTIWERNPLFLEQTCIYLIAEISNLIRNNPGEYIECYAGQIERKSKSNIFNISVKIKDYNEDIKNLIKNTELYKMIITPEIIRELQRIYSEISSGKISKIKRKFNKDKYATRLLAAKLFELINNK